MDNWPLTHSYLTYAHIWLAVKFAFLFVCLVGSVAMFLWCAAVAISAAVESHQAKSRRRRNNYRVGSVIR